MTLNSPVTPRTSPTRGVPLVLAAAVPLQAVAAEAEVEPRLVVALREAVLAGDGDVGELGLGQRAEAVLAVERELAEAEAHVGARLGDHGEVELEAGVVEAVAGLGVERAADAAQQAGGERIQLLGARGAGEQEQRGDQE